MHIEYYYKSFNLDIYYSKKPLSLTFLTLTNYDIQLQSKKKYRKITQTVQVETLDEKGGILEPLGEKKRNLFGKHRGNTMR